MAVTRTQARASSSRTASRHEPTPAVPTNRREQAYRALKADIVEGRLRPSEPLGEVELATRIGVSRTPVREALQRLAIEGLVSWIPGRGAFVSGLSVPDIVELFQLREALESHTARLAARSEHHADITQFLERFEQSRKTVKAGDFASYNRLTEEFDNAVVDLAHNSRIRSALADVWAQSARVRRLANRNLARILESVEEHERIVQAIAAAKEDAAAAAAGDHIRKSLQNVIESLANASNGSRG